MKMKASPLFILTRAALPMAAPAPTAIQKWANDATASSTGAKGRTNAIGTLIKGALLTVALFPGNINADVFYAWAAQDLVPKLPAGSIVVMDNAAFHKREDIKTCIGKAGHTLERL